MTIPQELIEEKNKVATTSSWIYIYHITFPVVVPAIADLFLTDSNRTETINGVPYYASSIKTGMTKQELKGKLNKLSVSIEGVTQILRNYIKATKGAVGGTVVVTEVNTDYPDADYSNLSSTYSISECNTDEKWINFSLSAVNRMIEKFPSGVYYSDYCWYARKFKGAECRSVDPSTSCAGTLAVCQTKLDPNGNIDNSKRFGGEIGLAQGGLRILS